MVSVIALKNYRRRSLGRLLTGGTKLRTALRLVSSSFFCASGTRTQILLASAANQCLLYPRKQTSGECSQMSAKRQEATSIAPNSCPRNEHLSCGPGQSRTRRTRRTYRTLCEQFLWSAVAYQGRHPLYLTFHPRANRGHRADETPVARPCIAEYRDVWSYIGGTTPLPNSTAPLSNVPSACFSAGTKTVSPG